MLGYIYFITNTITGKKYIGETINFKERKNKHLSYLRKDSHHSNKLQRAYNKYGEDNFEWSYEIYEIENEAELKIIEQKKIAEYDTYYNGYNCTLGGEGHNLIFDYNTASILYQILQRYEGVNRQIARFFNCDHTVINKLKNNDIYKDEIVEEKKIEEMINKLKLSENNLKNNYIPHNVKKLNKKQIFEILSIILDEKGYDNLLADIYNIDTKLLYRLKKNEIYIDYINEYNKLSHDEKIKLKEEVKNKYDLEHQRLNRKRGNVKNVLTQEQINYILDNKDNKKRVEIAKELEISADRVGSVINGKSYKDLVEKYYSSINKLPC